MKYIKKTLEEISNNFKILSDHNCVEIEQASKLMIQSLSKGGKIIFCGNGGSAADSQHLSAELIGRYRKNRKPLPSISLTTDTSAITAISNDFSFDKVFSRQLSALASKNDILYAISTSGKSQNIVNAIKEAKKKNIKIIGVTGASKKIFNRYCDVTISVPAIRPDRIQEMHIAVGQIICDIIEQKLC